MEEKNSNMNEHEKKRKKVAFFGHFDSSNFGNESTLQAILYHLRYYQPAAEVVCISDGPEAAAANHHIKAIPISETFFQSSPPETNSLELCVCFLLEYQASLSGGLTVL